jgi:hypothetical protein
MNPVENEAVVTEVYFFVNLRRPPDIAVLFVFVYFYFNVFLVFSWFDLKMVFRRHMNFILRNASKFY